MKMDFSKLAKRKRTSSPQTFLELFDQLDRKATHNSLRPVQIEALGGLQSQIAERDCLVKVSTGSGKTLVGLIYAEYMRLRYPGEPAIYLCPTNQLVEQVTDGATKIGVSTATFDSDGAPLDALEGKSVLVCTYDRMFNARSVLAKNNVQPCSVVLDDVHAGIDRVRQKYTLQVPPVMHDDIRQIFRPLCEGTDAAAWRGITNNEGSARFEVPYWLWVPQAKTIGDLLEKYRDHEALRFEWNNVSRYLEYCRLCISGTGAELSLPVAAVEENGPYNTAKHRLFMSASIKDGSSLIRDLSLDEAALSRVVEPPSDRGAGERLVLPVALIDPKMDKLSVATLCNELVSTANVVVLTSSAKQADAWVQAGAKLRQGKDVDAEIVSLRSTKRGRYVAFAQRFDGVDLPDDACRILVIDGTPTGERLCDQIDADRQKNSPGYNSRAINRFEQAMGRAVRSSADYAAILLVGTDVASFIGRKDVKESLEPHTREQIELGQDVAEQLRDSSKDTSAAIRSAIKTLINRDAGWKEAHRARMLEVERATRTSTGLTSLERAAVAERQAWMEAKARNHQRASAIIQDLINSATSVHPLQKAELLFRSAAYLHRVNPGLAANMYRGAFQLNSALPRPMEVADRRYTRIKMQAANFRDYFQQFTNANAALARLEEVRATLAYRGDADTVERGLSDLGELLGASSSRPERETGRGPDILWLFDKVGFCIEAKNEKSSPIFKKDAEQLLLSLEWCRNQHELNVESTIPVFATDVLQADRREDITFGPLVMTESTIQMIVDRIRTVLTSMTYDGPLFTDTRQLNERLIEASLRGEDIAKLLSKFRSR